MLIALACSPNHSVSDDGGDGHGRTTNAVLRVDLAQLCAYQYDRLVPLDLSCLTKLQTGLFTRCLLEYLTTPGLDIRKLFELVNQAVIERSNGEQEPVRAH